MPTIRLTIFSFLALLGVIFGASLVTSSYQKEFRRVEINGALIVAEVAADADARRLGLSGKENLAISSGMLFVFEHSDYYGIWMKGMKFPIDIIWIKNNQVVDLEENVLPSAAGTADNLLPVYRPEALADLVLETKAGFAKRNYIRIGDEVKIFSSFTGEKSVAGENPIPLATRPPEQLFIASPPSPPPAGSEFFIENLRKKSAQGGDFKIEKELERNSAYQKFLLSYKSGDLKISGIMNVPLGEPPPDGFPILILNHGLIYPNIYFPGRGSKREQDFFARHGYVTIHPDYRGLGNSSPAPFPILEHDFYVGYTEDVVNLIDSLKKLPPKLLDIRLDAKKIGMWGHSMGGGIAARVMVLRPEVRAFVLFAPISAEVEDNFYELSKKETARLRGIYGEKGAEVYKKMSPLTYFADVSSPVQLHHGTADKDVPLNFSEKMFAALKKYDKKAEFFKYSGEGHEFGDGWRLAAERALQFFDHYVKEVN